MPAPIGLISNTNPGRKGQVLLVAVAACCWSMASVAQEPGWAGWKTAEGGVVAWGFAEGEAFVSFTCNQPEGTIKFWNDGVLPGDFLNDPNVQLKVDGVEYRLRAEALFNEMTENYEGTAILRGDEDFLKAVASGTTMQIYDLVGKKYHTGEISLAGTGAMFSKYLSRCLVE